MHLILFLIKTNPISKQIVVPEFTNALNFGKKDKFTVLVISGGAIFSIAITKAGTAIEITAITILIVFVGVFFRNDIENIFIEVKIKKQ
ncbi:MAG: hypothetical protein IPF58_11605 [Saprospirales bacterium]|nr:hypothetical protein [Saprospirales bacterium]